ncbi:MAG: MFS transporter [Prevotella sp.]|nr:MFS transporter [Prevotella sp.]
MLLLTIIYIAFIGLGLPDSMFGTVWPAIYGEWRLPLSFGSFITTIIYGGTMVSSLLSTRMIKRFGTARTTIFSTTLTALAMLGFAFSGSFWILCLCALPLGAGAGAIDTALNNYVAGHYTARHMNNLHCFYGIGIVLSPYILSRVMQGDGGWRTGYLIVGELQAAIALLLVFTLPLWRKENGYADEETEDIPLRKLAAMRNVRLMWGLFVTSCTIEVSCGCYGSTFLVEQKGLATATAALVVTCFFAGIALGRFLSGIVAEYTGVWRIIGSGQLFLAIGILVTSLSDGIPALSISQLLMGLGIGPMFPNFCFLTPVVFGHNHSAAVMGSLFAVASLTGMTAPVLCGFFGQHLGMWIFPLFLLSFFVCMVAITLAANKAFWKEK